ncbi:ribosomal protein S18-alanine N-acetyltransferase [Microbacterium oleivorans]|uniref:Ribosomal protein S18-alanine N-acetyltransferase n=1 Tax=Microbacterium oleivorans TaxID=273677 RepID=A0A7D5IZY2_9MICO|nr:ribosomal protein S18-alanine N-acetyltransferase [Microbacterium oleivorans]QLD12335.1 ribosomal protein S18-alanine N-acetyltransferase [Microbacterium oleivorans]
MTLRAATRDDLDAIMTLEQESFPTDAWSRTAMAAELASPHGRYLVDDDDGRVIGYGGVRAARGADDADIQTIALAPGSRGTGRGRGLLRALLDEARHRGAREVFLEVRADNPVAQRLYLSEGFVEIARRPRYYQPDDVDAIIMQLRLASPAGGPGSERAGEADR